MKQLLCLFSLMILMTCKSQETNIKNQSSSEKQKTTKMVRESIYQFKVIDIEGKEFDFSSLKGKK
ncbi:glutathione peroxidase BsaA [Flavobacterium psychrophilum]|nr:glutathione peroxidase BsaA [Flavobacterium psychrophilum]